MRKVQKPPTAPIVKGWEAASLLGYFGGRNFGANDRWVNSLLKQVICDELKNEKPSEQMSKHVIETAGKGIGDKSSELIERLTIQVVRHTYFAFEREVNRYLGGRGKQLTFSLKELEGQPVEDARQLKVWQALEYYGQRDWIIRTLEQDAKRSRKEDDLVGRIITRWEYGTFVLQRDKFGDITEGEAPAFIIKPIRTKVIETAIQNIRERMGEILHELASDVEQIIRSTTRKESNLVPPQ